MIYSLNVFLVCYGTSLGLIFLIFIKTVRVDAVANLYDGLSITSLDTEMVNQFPVIPS